jgi:5'-nucleotidase
MKRRHFIRQLGSSTALAGLGGLPFHSCTFSGRKHITILHTNDVHSHIDPFPQDHAAYANLGGVARRAAMIEQVRAENPNTLLFDAGDIFQGTPYFNFYGGELELRLMSKMRYDAVTIGNHDFDNGLQGLLAQMPNANFPFLSANYDFGNTIMDGQVKPFQIWELDGIRIGVFGLGIRLEGLVNKSLYGETKYQDPIEVAQDVSRQLKEEAKCDLVICLSHLGYAYPEREDRISDVILASGTENIDLIIGGHTHTFLEKPVIRRNRREQQVLINQVGCYGINLGRIDFYFDHTKPARSSGVSIELSA